MVLNRMRRMQGLWQGRVLAAALVFVFVLTSGLSQACALAASTSSAATTHCGECPDRPSGDACASASLCVFAGTAVMRTELAGLVPNVAAPERIDLEQHRSASIFLVPPDPPPIRV
jgi:hypothetical protein